MTFWKVTRSDGTFFVIDAPDALAANLKALQNNHSESAVVSVEPMK